MAVIAPPYFRLDDRALLTHLEAAAAACAPLPFYVYEFARASGYPVPLPVLLGCASGAEPRRPEGVGRARGTRSRRTSSRASTSSSGRRRSSRREWPQGRSAPCPRSRPPSRTGSRRPCASRREAARRAGRPPRVRRALPAACGAEAHPRPARRADARGRPPAAAGAEGRRARGAARVARVVVAGAGAIGASIAYHLALRGARGRRARRRRRDRRRRDREGDGRRPAAVHDRAEVRLAQASVRLFRELGAPLFEQVGYLFLATTEQGLAELEERRALQAALGVPVERVDAGVVAACAPTTSSARRLPGGRDRRSRRRDARARAARGRARGGGAGAHRRARARRRRPRRRLRRPVPRGRGARGVEVPIRPLVRQLADIGPVAGLPADLPMMIEARRRSTSAASAPTGCGSR